LKVWIHDVNGAEILNLETLKIDNLQIDLSPYQSGIYFLNIQSEENNIQRKKIIKL